MKTIPCQIFKKAGVLTCISKDIEILLHLYSLKIRSSAYQSLYCEIYKKQLGMKTVQFILLFTLIVVSEFMIKKPKSK